MKRLITTLACAIAILSWVSTPALGGQPAADRGSTVSDNLKHPLGKTQFGLRQAALNAKLQGKARGRVYKVAQGQYAELEQERSDRIFVILAEFGTEVYPDYGGYPGPLHNQIAEPDRSVDNITIWQSNYNRAHYNNMYFTRMKDYYRSQSSGRYTFDGTIIEWVRVPFNEARYGANICGARVCSNTWFLIRDAINIWTANQIAAGRTLAQVQAFLETFDVWDRYDYDGDGNFDEPDRYIDHFQIVHAGEGEEMGGGAQGSDAIWSHRSYTAYFGSGLWGPPGALFGGMQFGGTGTYSENPGPDATGVWVGDYTIQPENGGLAVFAHEYGHDLGLPDHYDYSFGGENSTAFWNLMSNGDTMGDGTIDISSRPCDMSAWDKFQLGWLKYDVSVAGKRSSHRLGPAETNTKAAQALFTVLPPKAVVTVTAPPFAGSYAWYSDRGDNVDNSMTRTVALPSAGDLKLNLRAWWDIEQDWDYAYVSVSTDGGATFTNLASSITTNTSPNGQNFGNGITGNSDGWASATFDLAPYAGQTVQLRLRYWTDGFTQGLGFMADELAVVADGTTVMSDGAESSPNGWTLAGFKQSTGQDTTLHNHYYLSEFRQYRDYDSTLRTGPWYSEFFPNTKPNFVEHFPYQDGLLIHYWDTSQIDNNTSQHPGQGLVLPVDAHPEPLIRADGQPWRSRIQSFDSTFGLEPTDAITLHRNGVATSYPSLPAVSFFNDLNDYWSPLTPYAGVDVPKTGTIIEVININNRDNFMQVHVRPANGGF